VVWFKVAVEWHFLQFPTVPVSWSSAKAHEFSKSRSPTPHSQHDAVPEVAFLLTRNAKRKHACNKTVNSVKREVRTSSTESTIKYTLANKLVQIQSYTVP